MNLLLDDIPLGGMRLVQSVLAPIKRRPGPMAIHRSKGHPLVYWLSRQLARIGVTLEPDLLTPYQTWIEEPEVFVIGNTIYVHPKHYRALLETIRRGRTAA